MNGPRYKVAVVHGDIRPLTSHRDAPQQLAAHVLDRLNAHRCVGTFRSEDKRDGKQRRGRPGPDRKLGRAGAVAAATARADEWNADEGYPKERAPVKVPPDGTTTRDRRGRV